MLNSIHRGSALTKESQIWDQKAMSEGVLVQVEDKSMYGRELNRRRRDGDNNVSALTYTRASAEFYAILLLRGITVLETREIFVYHLGDLLSANCNCDAEAVDRRVLKEYWELTIKNLIRVYEIE